MIKVATSKPSLPARALNRILRAACKRPLGGGFDLVRLRRIAARLDRAFGRVPRGAALVSCDLGAIPSTWIEIAGAGRRFFLLYLHGGGYALSLPRTHAGFVARLCREIGAVGLLPEYRLAPEHPFPAAVDDVLATYRAALEISGDPRNVFVAGESAGGGLVLALLIRARDERLPLPAAAAAISGAFDLTFGGASHRENAERDPMIAAAAIRALRNLYLRGESPTHPLASPLHADLAGLPPILLTVGSTEMLRDDSTALAERIAAAGGVVELDVWPSMPHAFPLLPLLPESRRAIRRTATFFHAHATNRAGAPALLGA